MSFVIAVANMSRVVVKCDGLDRDIETGEINSQDYERIVSLNPNCIIGYTGSKELCEAIIDEYKRLASESNVDMNNLKPTTITYDLCELSKAMNTNNQEISFLVTGCENDRIVLFGLASKDEYELYNYSPVDENYIKYITLGSDALNGVIQFSNYYHGGNPIESTMNKYIKYISTLDPSVNDCIFTKKVNLSK